MENKDELPVPVLCGGVPLLPTIKVVLQRLSAIGLIETKTGQGSFVLPLTHTNT